VNVTKKHGEISGKAELRPISPFSYAGQRRKGAKREDMMAAKTQKGIAESEETEEVSLDGSFLI
jgi:hypothetical protein